MDVIGVPLEQERGVTELLGRHVFHPRPIPHVETWGFARHSGVSRGSPRTLIFVGDAMIEGELFRKRRQMPTTSNIYFQQSSRICVITHIAPGV